MISSRKPHYRSDALEDLHKTVSGLHRHGAIDKAFLRHFDLGCLTPAESPRRDEESSDPLVITAGRPKLLA